jgi:hypothetical protein
MVDIVTSVRWGVENALLILFFSACAWNPLTKSCLREDIKKQMNQISLASSVVGYNYLHYFSSILGWKVST